VQGKAGAYAGTKKYGEAANLPASAMKKRGMRGGGASSPSPGGGGSRAAGARGGVKSPGENPSSSRVHKPHLDEMHGPESLPYRPGRATPRKPSPDDTGAGSGSKIFQPTDSRQSGPEFGPAPRSTGGAPGHRGGWKKR
jgi:excinuclease ABC subunit B